MHPEDRAEWARQQAEEAPDTLVLSVRQRRAAKPHRCDWCGRPIPIGTLYQHFAYIEDNTFKYSNVCGSCIYGGPE